MSRFQRSPRLLTRRDALTSAFVSALAAAGCASPAPRQARNAEPPATGMLIEAHNRARQDRGLPPLTPNERLQAAARRHADDMAARGRMSHRGSDGSSPFRRIERAGYPFRRAGENVAYGQRTVGEVMSAWMRSPGHRRNVLGDFKEIGAACATDATATPCWCVTFGRPETA